MNNKQIKRVFYLLTLVGVLIIVGFGCKSLSTEQQAMIRPVALDYWTIYDNVEQLQKLAANYKRIRPYVTVNVRQVRYDEFEKLFTNALADDVSPDIVSMHVRWLGKYQSRLSTMPDKVNMATIVTTGKYFPQTTVTPDEVIMPSLETLKSSYVATAYDDIVFGDKIYGLPLSLDTLAIYYNKDLLDKAGVPEPPKTWQDFMEAVKLGTKFDKEGNILQSGVALGTGNNIDNTFDVLSLFMMQSGVVMQDHNYIAFATGLNRNAETHPTIRALNFYTDFAQSDKDVYSWNEKMDNALDNFARGKSVFYLGFAYDYPRIRALGPQLNVEIIPVPQLNENSPVNVASYWVESVSKKSKHQNEAWDFIRFITSAANVKRYTEATKTPAPFRSMINEQKKDLMLAPFANEVLNAKNWYRGHDYDTAKKTFLEMIHNYIQPPGDEDKMKRDVENIIYTSRIIQQTM